MNKHDFDMMLLELEYNIVNFAKENDMNINDVEQIIVDKLTKNIEGGLGKKDYESYRIALDFIALNIA